MKRVFLAAAVIALIALAAYANSFNAAFELDDYHQIVENPYIRDASNIPMFFFDPKLGTGWSSYFGVAGYRPITYASFAVSYALSGYGLFGYHVFNFVLHVINALLVFFIAKMLFDEAWRRDSFPEALLVSAVFAAHPIQTGAVTYVSGRAVLLASFFCLAGFASFLGLRRAGPDEGAKRLVLGTLGPLCYLLGLMSKEMAVSLIALLAAYDLLFTLPSKAGPGRLRDMWHAYVPFIAVLLFYLVLRRSVLGYASALPAYGVYEYLVSEARALLVYLRVFLLPVNQNADYSLPPAASFDAYAAVSLALVGAALAFAYKARARAPVAAFMVLWFLAALSPESTLFPITDIAVEYRMYLPSVGLVCLAVLIGAAALRRLPRLRLPAAAVIVAMLALLSFGRNSVWATPTSFWSDALRKSPWSARAHANLGKALMDEKRYPEAAREFGVYLRGARDDQERYLVLNNLGLCYAEMGRLNDAVRTLLDARAIFPDNADAYYNLGFAYERMGRKDEAAAALREAGRLTPSAAGGE